MSDDPRQSEQEQPREPGRPQEGAPDPALAEQQQAPAQPGSSEAQQNADDQRTE